MWKIDVESVEVHTKSGVSAKTGKPYTIREQEAWIYAFAADGKAYKHAQRMRIMLADDAAPYPVGVYYLHPGSAYVDRWGQASIKASLMPARDFQTWLRTVFTGPQSIERSAA